MNKIISEFCRRGMAASGLGPLVLAVLYLILQSQGLLESLTVRQVATGIFSLWALAFVAGGMNVVYRIERLPLMVAILLHGGVLYISYLVTYLLNDWLESGMTPILVFSAIFVCGYLAVWAIIYIITKRNTDKVNEMLHKKQQQNSGLSRS